MISFNFGNIGDHNRIKQVLRWLNYTKSIKNLHFNRANFIIDQKIENTI